MTDIDTLATSLYGKTTPDPAPPHSGTALTPAAPAPKPALLHPRDANLYGDAYRPPALPPGTLKLEDALYRPETELRTTLEPLQATYGDVLGMTLAQRQAANRDAVAIARTGLSTGVVKTIVEAAVGDAVAVTRGAEIDLEERAQQWKEESRGQLRESVVAQSYDVEDLAQRAEAFVNKHPQLRDALGPSGLKWRPDIFMALIEHVRLNNVR
jgi:hypothetical protein